ncbi:MULTISPECIES: hypothetical protein [unclassified Sphingobium]|uniref:hypothetical protein n=1 Tax=unclassified Sphingobium TaxID=2611147 RepID=UPI0015E73558|nr:MULTISPECIES: hypothetical protein [unclassified Sphingobium]
MATANVAATVAGEPSINCSIQFVAEVKLADGKGASKWLNRSVPVFPETVSFELCDHINGLVGCIVVGHGFCGWICPMGAERPGREAYQRIQAICTAISAKDRLQDHRDAVHALQRHGGVRAQVSRHSRACASKR